MGHRRLLGLRTPGLVALILIFIAASTARGRTEPQPRRAEVRVSWPALVALVDRHPRLAAARQRTAAARAAVDVASVAPNPVVAGSAGYGAARDGPASRAEWGLELSMPLDWLARRGPSKRAAAAEARAANAEAQALRREVLLELRTLFWTLIHAQARVAALNELSAQTAALARTVQQRVDKGERRPVEAMRAKVEAERTAGQLALAAADLQARRAQLGLWLGLSKGHRLTAVAELNRLPSASSLSRAAQRARNHPTILAARARVDALQAGVTVQRWARVPAFSVMAFTDHELDRSAYGAGLSIEVPLWNWNSGRIRRAEAALAAGRHELAADQLRLQAKVIDAQSSCKSRVALARRYQDRIVPRAASAARAFEQAHELGEARLLEVIDARRTLLETKTQLLSALLQAQSACSRLAVLTGETLQ